ncbi:MAG: hypothetical protein SOV18_07105 [Eubacteriales bacterium]|nr:hypothetical protein [Eubacteriales bacterium]
MNIVEVINYKCKKVKMYGRLLHFVLMSGKTYHLRTAQISLAASVNITVPHGARKGSTKRKRTNEPREVRVFAPPSKSRARGDERGVHGEKTE